MGESRPAPGVGPRRPRLQGLFVVFMAETQRPVPGAVFKSCLASQHAAEVCDRTKESGNLNGIKEFRESGFGGSRPCSFFGGSSCLLFARSARNDALTLLALLATAFMFLDRYKTRQSGKG